MLLCAASVMESEALHQVGRLYKDLKNASTTSNKLQPIDQGCEVLVVQTA